MLGASVKKSDIAGDAGPAERFKPFDESDLSPSIGWTGESSCECYAVIRTEYEWLLCWSDDTCYGDGHRSLDETCGHRQERQAASGARFCANSAAAAICSVASWCSMCPRPGRTRSSLLASAACSLRACASGSTILSASPAKMVTGIVSSL